MENKEFIEDYLNEDKDVVEVTPDTEDKPVTEHVVKVSIVNDQSDYALSSLLSAFILNKVSNKTIINYESDDIPDKINKYQKDLSEDETDSKTLDGIDIIEVSIGTSDADKMTAKAVYRILDTKFTNGEFEAQPLEEIFGSIALIKDQLEQGELFFYKDDEPYAYWGYKYQPDIIGKPGNFIVLYSANELEIIKDPNDVINNFKVPTLKELLKDVGDV